MPEKKAHVEAGDENKRFFLFIHSPLSQAMEKTDIFFPKTGYDVSFCDRIVSWQKFLLTRFKIVLGSLSDNDEEGDKNSKHFYVYAPEKKKSFASGFPSWDFRCRSSLCFREIKQTRRRRKRERHLKM